MKSSQRRTRRMSSFSVEITAENGGHSRGCREVMGGHLGLRHCRRLFQPWSARFAGSLCLFPFSLPAQKLRAALLSIDQCPQVSTPSLRRCHLLSGLCVPVLRLLRSFLWGSRNLRTAGSLKIVLPCSDRIKNLATCGMPQSGSNGTNDSSSFITQLSLLQE